MKGLIVEIRGNEAALLSDDGCVVKVQNKNYKVGQEIDINMNKKFKKLTAIVAACFMLVIGGGSALAYYTPTKYVSLDVNPSLEYQLNMFDRVLTIKGVNEDGTNIIDNVDVNKFKNKSIDDAIAETVDLIAENGYLEDEETEIIIAASSNNSEKLVQSLQETVDEVCKSNNYSVTVNVEAVGSERVKEAKELGVTPGKLNLVEKLIESSNDPENIDFDEWLNKTAKEINAQIKQYKQQSKENNCEQEQNADENSENQEQNKNNESNSNGSDNGKGNGNSNVSQGKDTDKGQGNSNSDVSQGKGTDKGQGNSNSDVSQGKGTDKGQGNSNSDVSQGKGTDNGQGNSNSDVSQGKGTDNGQGNSNPDASQGKGTDKGQADSKLNVSKRNVSYYEQLNSSPSSNGNGKNK